MNKGGRRRDPVWDSFDESKSLQKVQAKCKKCGHIQSNKAERMRAHQKSCFSNKRLTSIPEIQLDEPEQSGFEMASSSGSLAKKAKPNVDGHIDPYIVRTSSATKDVLDLLVGSFFYACSIPFSAVEHPSFKALISKLRPGYSSPTRKALAGPILDKSYEKIKMEMKADLVGKNGCYMVDGWSNIHNDPITVACIQVDGKTSYPLEAIDTGSTSKSAEFMTAESNRIISETEKHYQCKIRAVVTDNAKNMVKMRKKMEEQNPELITYGCSAHWMNLLGIDITVPAIVKHIVEIQKYFCNHHAPAAWLKETPGTLKPQLPGDTRWNSQVSCVETYLKNHSALLVIANDHTDELEENIVSLIRNFNLLQQAKDLLKQLKPIPVALDKLQADGATIADASHEWLKLL